MLLAVDAIGVNLSKVSFISDAAEEHLLDEGYTTDTDLGTATRASLGFGLLCSLFVFVLDFLDQGKRSVRTATAGVIQHREVRTKVLVDKGCHGAAEMQWGKGSC